MGATLDIQLGEHVVEQEQRRPAVARRQQVDLGELDGQDRGSLLAAGSVLGEVSCPEREDNVVAVGTDEGRAVPDLLVGRLDEPSGEGVANRLGRVGRRIRLVAEPECV